MHLDEEHFDLQLGHLACVQPPNQKGEGEEEEEEEEEEEGTEGSEEDATKAGEDR